MAKIKHIRCVSYRGKVHDLCVENTSTYNAEGIAVHNSAAGSLVLYCLGVTKVDPIRFNLLFERFLDASRLEEIINSGGKVSGGDYPDVDIDWSDRGAVIAYLRSKYGPRNTCAIGTVIRFKNKSLLLDLARMHGVDLGEAYRVTKGQLAELGDEGEDMDVVELRKKSNDLDKFLIAHPDIVDGLNRLRGQIAANGVHAAGMLVSDMDLTDLIPVRKAGDAIVSCWEEGGEGRELGRMGFIKIDVLAISAMDQIRRVVDMINSRRGLELDPNTIPVDDQRAIDLGNRQDFLGVWQLDTPVSVKVVNAMKGIRCFEDISVVNALMRPSALLNQFHVKFGMRRSGHEQYYIPEQLKPYLHETYGLPIYQEAAYHIALHLAGFTIVDAYKFMKLLYKGKMKGDLVETWRHKFMEGCKEAVVHGGCDANYPEQIFNELLTFQGYGFCKAHSISYSFFASVQLYLKARYPQEFMCVLLQNVKPTAKRGHETALSFMVRECRKRDIPVLPPDINQSSCNWHIEDDGLRMPLGWVSGIGKAELFLLNNGPYKDFDDFLGKCVGKGIHKSVVESLIFSGAMDQFGDRPTLFNRYKNYDPENRAGYLLDLDVPPLVPEMFFTARELEKRERDSLGFLLNDDIVFQYRDKLKDKRIKTMSEVQASKVKYPLVLARVDRISSFKTKAGDEKRKIHVSDGRCNAEIMCDVSTMDMNRTRLSPGNILAFPVFVPEDNRNFYFLSNSKDIEIIYVHKENGVHK